VAQPAQEGFLTPFALTPGKLARLWRNAAQQFVGLLEDTIALAH
jgi:hypothetical protein